MDAKIPVPPRPSATDLVEVGLHQFKHDVNVLEVVRRWRQHDVLDLNNVCEETVVKEATLIAIQDPPLCDSALPHDPHRQRRGHHATTHDHLTWMSQQPEQLDLTQNAGSVRDMVEHVGDLLDRHLFTWAVNQQHGLAPTTLSSPAGTATAIHGLVYSIESVDQALPVN